MAALLIDARSGRRVPAIEQLERILGACRHHARWLRSERELALVRRLARHNGALRQLAHASRDGNLRCVSARLAGAYAPRTAPMHAVTKIAC
jgi:gamma-glutamyl:cysteine ligase YbdK (ATP-grasp superfamily)